MHNSKLDHPMKVVTYMAKFENDGENGAPQPVGRRCWLVTYVRTLFIYANTQFHSSINVIHSRADNC